MAPERRVYDITDTPEHRRRRQQDLAAFEQAHPDAKDPVHTERLGTQLDLVAEVTAPPPRGRGRPGRGIMTGYRQVSVFLPPDALAQLDRLVDLEEQHTRRAVNRTDLIREAVLEYIERRLATEAAPSAPVLTERVDNMPQEDPAPPPPLAPVEPLPDARGAGPRERGISGSDLPTPIPAPPPAPEPLEDPAPASLVKITSEPEAPAPPLTPGVSEPEDPAPVQPPRTAPRQRRTRAAVRKVVALPLPEPTPAKRRTTAAPRLMTEVIQEVIEHMRAHPEPQTRTALVRALGITRTLPDHLVTEGVLQRTAPNTYVLAEGLAQPVAE